MNDLKVIQTFLFLPGKSKFFENFCLENQIILAKLSEKNRIFLKICLEKSKLFLSGSTTPRFQTRLTPLFHTVHCLGTAQSCTSTHEGDKESLCYVKGVTTLG